MVKNTQVNQCPIYPNQLLTKGGNCSRAYRCNEALDSKCPVNKTNTTKLKINGGGMTMDEKLYAELSEIKLDVDNVVKLLKSGMTTWEVTEKVYDTEFDHADKKTWKFYSKVNSIRKRHGLST